MTDTFDLVVIGAGSGGVRAARMAAGRGARVVIVESRFFGGTCVNVGCVPKKLFVYASEFPALARLAGDFGFCLESSFDWATLRDNKTREIERLNGIYRRLLKDSGVTIVEGHGQIVAPGQVQVGDQLLSARHVLIATGGRPWLPMLPGIERARVSDDLFYLENWPERVAIYGGGYIACEFAAILSGLGVEVHQLFRGERLLKEFDQEMADFVARQSGHRIRLYPFTEIHAIDEQGEQKHLTLSRGEPLRVDEVFFATGRVANTEGLFSSDVSPELQSGGGLVVDENYATSLPGVYAIGDVIDRAQLTPVALAEGMWLVDHLFAESTLEPLDYDMIPTAVFCHPNLATIGLTEAQAREKHDKLRIYRSEFRPLRYSLGDSAERTLMKLIVDDASDRIVGLHMAGEEAAEMLQGFAVAVQMGATKADFDRTLGIHPTAAEELVTLRQVSSH